MVEWCKVGGGVPSLSTLPSHSPALQRARYPFHARWTEKVFEKSHAFSWARDLQYLHSTSTALPQHLHSTSTAQEALEHKLSASSHVITWCRCSSTDTTRIARDKCASLLAILALWAFENWPNDLEEQCLYLTNFMPGWIQTKWFAPVNVRVFPLASYPCRSSTILVARIEHNWKSFFLLSTWPACLTNLAWGLLELWRTQRTGGNLYG